MGRIPSGILILEFDVSVVVGFIPLATQILAQNH